MPTPKPPIYLQMQANYSEKYTKDHPCKRNVDGEGEGTKSSPIEEELSYQWIQVQTEKLAKMLTKKDFDE